MSLSTSNLIVNGNFIVLGNITGGGNITFLSSNVSANGISCINGITVSSGQVLVQSGNLSIFGGAGIAGNYYSGGNVNLLGNINCSNFSAINVFQQTLNGNLSYTSSSFLVGSGYKLITCEVASYSNGSSTCSYTITILSSGNTILDTYSRNVYLGNGGVHFNNNFNYVTGNSILSQNIKVNILLTVVSGSTISNDSGDYLSMTMLCLPS